MVFNDGCPQITQIFTDLFIKHKLAQIGKNYPPTNSPEGEGPVTPEAGEQAGVVITLVTYHLSLIT